jgi:hypothetical protein
MNIVLVHGILGFRKRFGIEYFGGVAEHFRTKGLAVLVPELDPTKGNYLLDSTTYLGYDFVHGEQDHERTKEPARSNRLLL